MSRSPVVLVTGASRGLGLATAQILVEKFKAKVVTLSRSKTPQLEELSKSYPDALLNLQGDVTDSTVTSNAVSQAQKTFGSLDGLVLNAGTIEPIARIESTSVEDWKNLFDVNFFSLVHTLHAALPLLRDSEFGGKVIFVSSGAAVSNVQGWGPYNASKAAMNSLCRTFANEEKGIVSVALRPGVVDTEMQTLVRNATTHMLDSERSRFVDLHAYGKLAKPEVVGHVVAALALNAPKELTGQFVSWDGKECEEFRKKD